MRASPIDHPNTRLGDWTKWASGKSNVKFAGEALRVMRDEYGVGNGGLMVIGLVGSRDFPSVIVRQAQAALRWDRRPGLWSHVFLINEAWDRNQQSLSHVPLLEVPLFRRDGQVPEPAENGLNRTATLGDYRDPELDANIALLAVAYCAPTSSAEDSTKKLVSLSPALAQDVAKRADDPNRDRLRYDLWENLCAWQRYVWSENALPNPMTVSIPHPAAGFAEMAFEGARLDLTPSATERRTAPEHIWNAAKWWHQTGSSKFLITAKEAESASNPESNEQDPTFFVLCGCFALRDPDCTLRPLNFAETRRPRRRAR